MEHRATSRQDNSPSAEHIALQALGAYDADPIQRPPNPPRRREEDGRLIRLALLPLASWCLGMLFNLSAFELLCAVLVAGFVAATIALWR